MFHERRLIINVIRQIENKHTSFDNRDKHASFVKSEIRRSKKTDDEMIKHDHENESF